MIHFTHLSRQLRMQRTQFSMHDANLFSFPPNARVTWSAYSSSIILSHSTTATRNDPNAMDPSYYLIAFFMAENTGDVGAATILPSSSFSSFLRLPFSKKKYQVATAKLVVSCSQAIANASTHSNMKSSNSPIFSNTGSRTNERPNPPGAPGRSTALASPVDYVRAIKYRNIGMNMIL